MKYGPFLILALATLVACEGASSPRATTGLAAQALKDSNLPRFRRLLQGQALERWGTFESFTELRGRLELYGNLRIADERITGQEGDRDSFEQRTLSELKVEALEQNTWLPLLRVEVTCQTHRERASNFPGDPGRDYDRSGYIAPPGGPYVGREQSQCLITQIALE